ncbi:Prenylated Rab acceptor protein 1, partial [Armadillidium nasatum]
MFEGVVTIVFSKHMNVFQVPLLLTSPLLLVAVAASLGACYIASLKNAERKLVIGGHELTLPQQYIGIGVISVPIFYLAGATTAIFWVIGASFFVIMLHATLYDIESIVGSEDQPFDLQMEE